MANSFSKQITFENTPILVVIVPELRKNGLHYEININGYPRFFMGWSALGRYDLTGEATNLPYELILLVSDVLEQYSRRKK